MELGIKDRIYLMQVLPDKNTFKEFSTKKSIITKIQLTSADHQFFDIQHDAESKTVTWNKALDAEHPLDVEFSAEELEYMRKGCENVVDGVYPDDFWSTVERVYNLTAN